MLSPSSTGRATLAAVLALALAGAWLALADRVTKLADDPYADLDQYTTARPTALVRMPASKKRDFGLFALKAILLGPLIGLTIKAALVRGLIWAVLAYGLHLFFPSLLSFLGLGTGLVGFARQLRPDYNQMFMSYFLNLVQTLPVSVSGLSGQYQQLIGPVVESIRAIPEGHCRYRAVCETASQLIRSSRSMSASLQRISATVYMNFGNQYSKAWLDGIVQNDCAAKYSQCTGSPFSMVAARLAQTIGSGRLGLSGAAAAAAAGQPGPWAPQLVDAAASATASAAPVAEQLVHAGAQTGATNVV